MLSRYEAIKAVVGLLKNELVIHCNGMPARESFTLRDRPGNFYMIGSMGMACPIGLGVALSKPHRRVVIFDGDGNVLMNLGSLALVGALKPRNFLHIVFDNGTYASTGHQPTISDRVNLDDLSRAAGYAYVRRVTEEQSLTQAVRELLSLDGPSFLLVKVDPAKEGPEVGRVSLSPEAITRRFMAAVAASPSTK